MSVEIAFAPEDRKRCTESRCQNFGRPEGACRAGHYGQDDTVDRLAAAQTRASQALIEKLADAPVLASQSRWDAFRARVKAEKKPEPKIVYDTQTETFGPERVAPKEAAWMPEWRKYSDRLMEYVFEAERARARRIACTQIVRVRLAALEEIAECCRAAEVKHTSKEMAELSCAVRAMVADICGAERMPK